MERIGARTKSNHGLGLDGDITGGPAWAASSSAVHHPPVRLICHTTDELTYLTAKGAKRATIALARKLLTLIYTMLKTGQLM